MPPSPDITNLRQRALDNIAERCAAAAQAADSLSSARQAVRQAIIDANSLGCSFEQIAAAAGISKTRAHQIARGTKRKPRPSRS